MTTGSPGPISQVLREQMSAPLPPEIPQESGDAALAKAVGEDEYEAPEIDEPDGFVMLPMGLKNHPEFGDVSTAEVRELTGLDEEKISRVVGSDNPWRVGTTLLECGVDRLGDKKPTRAMLDALPMGDRDYLLLHIRVMTYGETVTYDLKCPFCDREQSVDVNLKDDIPLREDADQNPIKVDLTKGRTATVWVPTGKDDEMILREQVKNSLTSAETDTLLIAECVSEISDGVWLGRESALNLSVRDRAAILKAMTDGQPGPDFTQMMVQCVGCDDEYRLPISLPELFR